MRRKLDNGRFCTAIMAGLAVYWLSGVFYEGHVLGFGIVCDKSEEMQPTFWPGECVFTVPVLNRNWRGEIVVFGPVGSIGSRSHTRLTRVVGLPSESLKLEAGAFHVDPYRQSPGRTNFPTFTPATPTVETVEGLPPQKTFTRWVQSNSALKRETWPGVESYVVFWLDGGELWSKKAISAELGADAYLVAGDNRDLVKPAIVGFSAISRRPFWIVWSPDKARLFTLPR